MDDGMRCRGCVTRSRTPARPRDTLHEGLAMRARSCRWQKGLRRIWDAKNGPGALQDIELLRKRVQLRQGTTARDIASALRMTENSKISSVADQAEVLRHSEYRTWLGFARPRADAVTVGSARGFSGAAGLAGSCVARIESRHRKELHDHLTRSYGRRAAAINWQWHWPDYVDKATGTA